MSALGQRLVGLYTAVVVDVDDPDGLGRVKVRLPWVREDQGEQATAWARLATMMAGADRGTWFVPEPQDEVVLAFMAGDPRHPVVVGALWNGVDAPPEAADPENNVRSITSRSGHRLVFDDTAGAQRVEVTTQGGHELVLDDASGGTITVTHSGGSEIVIDAAGTVKVTALSRVEVSAVQLDVSAPLSTFSGVVKADSVITNAVVSSTYTMGAGNIW